jgi:hypothetical protein
MMRKKKLEQTTALLYYFEREIQLLSLDLGYHRDAYSDK